MEVRLARSACYVRTNDPAAVQVMRSLGYRPKTIDGTRIYRVNWLKAGDVYDALKAADAKFWM